MTYLDPDPFLRLKAPLADVRSPIEYEAGHIGGASNVPLFSDEERKAVGTVYKQEGMKQAFHLGLEYVGSKLASLVRELETHAGSGDLRLYCFRGGMRSSSIADLLGKTGIRVYTLKGGYKAYRRLCRSVLQSPLKLIVVGGKTGSGKTDFLNALKMNGEQVLNLEERASHRGSVFGHLQMNRPPTQEQFENLIAEDLFFFDRRKPIWIEDESRMIGPLKIPDSLFNTMQRSPLIALERTDRERVKILLDTYTPVPLGEFEESVLRIHKKLGGQKTKKVLELARQAQWMDVVQELLEYYDKAYSKSLKAKNPVMLEIGEGDASLAKALSQAGKLKDALSGSFFEEIANKL